MNESDDMVDIERDVLAPADTVFSLFNRYTTIPEPKFKEMLANLMSTPEIKAAGGINILSNDVRRETVLHFALRTIYSNYKSSTGNEFITALVQTAGIDLNIQDVFGCTPLFYAVDCGAHHVIAEMLKHGADPKILCNDGTTAVHRAVISRDYDMILPFRRRNLLNQSSIVDKYGYTPAMLIAIWPITKEYHWDLQISSGLSDFATDAMASSVLVEFPYEYVYDRLAARTLTCQEFLDLIDVYDVVCCAELDESANCCIRIPFDVNKIIRKERVDGWEFFSQARFHWGSMEKSAWTRVVTLLSIALETKQFEIAGYLISNGATFAERFTDLQINGSPGLTYFGWCEAFQMAYTSNLEGLRFLISHGLDPNYTSGLEMEFFLKGGPGYMDRQLFETVEVTLALFALGRHNERSYTFDVISVLIAAGLDVQKKQPPRFPYLLADYRSHQYQQTPRPYFTVFDLMERRSNFNHIPKTNLFGAYASGKGKLREKFVRTVMEAIKTGNTKFMDEVLTWAQHQTIFNINDTTDIPDGASYLELSVYGEKPYETTKLILQKATHVFVNVLFQSGSTAMHRAVELGNIDLIDLLVNYGANINIQIEPSLQTPLHWAVLHKNYTIGAHLVKIGADTSIKNKYGEDIMGCIRSNVPTPKQQDHICAIIMESIKI